MEKGPKGLRRRSRKHKTHCYYWKIREWVKHNPKISNKMIAYQLNLSVSQASRIICNMIKDGALAYRNVERKLKTTLSGKLSFTSIRELVVVISRKTNKLIREIKDLATYLLDSCRPGESSEVFRNFSFEQAEQIDRLNKPPSPLDVHLSKSLKPKYKLGWGY